MAATPEIEHLIAQEQALQFSSFDEDAAFRLGMALRDAAVGRKLTLVIDIRVGSRQLFYTALPGTSTDNGEWVRRKSNVALRFHKSSYRYGREMVARGEEVGPNRGLNLLDYAPAGGSFPIGLVGTGCIGAVTVSGLPQRDDHEFVVEGLCAFLKQDYAKLKLPKA